MSQSYVLFWNGDLNFDEDASRRHLSKFIAPDKRASLRSMADKILEILTLISIFMTTTTSVLRLEDRSSAPLRFGINATIEIETFFDYETKLEVLWKFEKKTYRPLSKEPEIVQRNRSFCQILNIRLEQHLSVAEPITFQRTLNVLVF